MWRFVLRLVMWDLSRKRARLLLMVLAIFGTLSTYVLFGAILNDVAIKAMQLWRVESPYDIVVTGAQGDLAEKIMALPGVVRVDATQSAEVILATYPATILAIGDESLYVLECEEGLPPHSPDEIALPMGWKTAAGLTVGDKIGILPMTRAPSASVFVVSGFLSNKARVPQQAVVHASAIEQFGGAFRTEIQVALDGVVSLDRVKSQIQGLPGGHVVVVAEEQYAAMQSGMNIADMLLTSMRFLILIIAASAMGVLTFLTQREQAYQSGVLRAMGLSRPWLVIAPLVQGLLVFSTGGALSFAILPLLARPLGLLSGAVTTLDLFLSQAGVFILFGLSMILLTALAYSYRSIPSLLKDVWGQA